VADQIDCWLCDGYAGEGQGGEGDELDHGV
jgi:hypothetical protein